VLDLDSLRFAQGGHLMANRKTIVPEGAWRTQKKGYEEVHVPAMKVPPASPDEPIVYIKDLPEWAQPAFPKTDKLNRVQSRLYQTGTVSDIVEHSHLFLR
jgi:pre-mRNA-splicing helicase BRR2